MSLHPNPNQTQLYNHPYCNIPPPLYRLCLLFIQRSSEPFNICLFAPRHTASDYVSVLRQARHIFGSVNKHKAVCDNSLKHKKMILTKNTSPFAFVEFVTLHVHFLFLKSRLMCFLHHQLYQIMHRRLDHHFLKLHSFI